MAEPETFEQAARRILDAPFTWPDAHVLNEGITPVGAIECSVMSCGAVHVKCSDGKFRPEMEIYTMAELGNLRADIDKGRPVCARCKELAGL